MVGKGCIQREFIIDKEAHNCAFDGTVLTMQWSLKASCDNSETGQSGINTYLTWSSARVAGGEEKIQNAGADPF
jgi:hypothetical protein